MFGSQFDTPFQIECIFRVIPLLIVAWDVFINIDNSKHVSVFNNVFVPVKSTEILVVIGTSISSIHSLYWTYDLIYYFYILCVDWDMVLWSISYYITTKHHIISRVPLISRLFPSFDPFLIAFIKWVFFWQFAFDDTFHHLICQINISYILIE